MLQKKLFKKHRVPSTGINWAVSLNLGCLHPVALYCSISFEVKLPSACSFIVDGLAFCCRCSHYIFRPTWPSSGVCYISLFIPEGIASLLLLHVVILCSF
jgi:hypothetical protein